ncbi:MAG: hypothetical protein GY863_08340 [bacterium]|nr:hypothetical protein [bacterium]
MKKLSLIFVIVFAVLVLIPVSSQTVYAQLIAKDRLEKSFDQMSAFFVSVAEAMPAENFEFKPTEEMMTFAAQMKHVAGSFYWIGRNMLKKEGESKPQEGTTKVQIVADMKAAVEFAKSALKEISLEGLEEEMDFFDGAKRTRFHALLFGMDHMTHHKGYCLVYLRLNGVTPPGYVGW